MKRIEQLLTAIAYCDTHDKNAFYFLLTARYIFAKIGHADFDDLNDAF
jgi:hypothetical protein